MAMKKRPEDHILTTPDPEEFRCKKCNPNGWNRTGFILKGYINCSTTNMWGVPCGECIDGWKENG